MIRPAAIEIALIAGCQWDWWRFFHDHMGIAAADAK